MVRIELQIGLDYQVNDAQGADFIFNIHPAQTACQTVAWENLLLSQDVVPELSTDRSTGSRFMRLHADPGPLSVSYRALVDIDHHFSPPETLAEVPVRALPLEVMHYVYPSRYCESDRLVQFAFNQFGQLQPGYARVLAVQHWVQKHVRFSSNTSNSNTSAVDTLIAQVGVCRDFAHLMIALCRALNIPARIASGTDYGADPALGPPDFHAYVEVYLGTRWYLFDASGTAIPAGMLRIGTGRDAADIAFATIFGAVGSGAPRIDAKAVADASGKLVLPRHYSEAISTDAREHSQERPSSRAPSFQALA